MTKKKISTTQQRVIETVRTTEEQTFSKEEAQELVNEIAKWRRRAETLHLMALHNANANAQTTQMLNATNERLKHVQDFLITDERLHQIEELAGKPVVGCPTCGKIFASSTGKTGWAVCDECYAKNETAWPDEVVWNITKDGKLCAAYTTTWNFSCSSPMGEYSVAVKGEDENK